ncbi:MAG: M48 family metalloprotease [Burkholderiales bacterium]
MERRKLTGLRPQTYEHPLDTKALDALEGTPGLETLVRKCNEWGFERLLRVQLTGSNLRVTADNFPEIHAHLKSAAEILDLPHLPEIYIASGGDINAFTAGVEKTIVVLTSAAVDQLTDDELFFVIAHELGHIKSGHVLYYQMAEFIPVLGDIIGGLTLGIGGVVSTGLQVALLNWKRMSEFTADRAGLLATQDVNAAVSTMMKLAGLPQKSYGAINNEDFLAQAREFEGLDTDKLSWLAKGLSVMGQEHPWTVMRASEFLKWTDGGGYERVLNAKHDSPTRHCTQCGRTLGATQLFCPHCGAKAHVAQETTT